MQENSTLLYFKSVPERTAYWRGDIAEVPNKTAEKYIFDDHALDASKVLDSKPYFNPEEVEALSSPKEVKKYVEKKNSEIIKLRESIESSGKEINRISGKITEIRRKRSKEKKGSYDYVQFDMQIDDLAEKLPELEKAIKKAALEKRKAEVLYYNAQIKFYNETFTSLTKADEFQELDEQVKALIKKNEQVKKLFKEATGGINLGFMPDKPFLSGRGLGLIQNKLGKSDQILSDISERLSKRFKGKLSEIYKNDFEGELRDDE